jgi:hypothetical protein
MTDLRWLVVAGLLLVGLVLAYGMAVSHQTQECYDRGGTEYVSVGRGHICIDAEGRVLP